MPKPRAACFALSLMVSVCSASAVLAQDDDPLAPSNYTTAIAKQLAENLRKPQQLKQVSVTFVDTAKAKLSCKLAVFPVYEMVMRFQASAQQMQASFAASREKLKAAGVSTESLDQAQAESIKTFQKETRLRLEQIDEYCAAAK